MKSSITLYDALTSISMPSGKTKAVVEAWENEVKDLASKSDLGQTERHLKASISELGAELRVLIREQGVELRSSVKEQGLELRSSITALERPGQDCSLAVRHHLHLHQRAIDQIGI